MATLEAEFSEKFGRPTRKEDVSGAQVGVLTSWTPWPRWICDVFCVFFGFPFFIVSKQMGLIEKRKDGLCRFASSQLQ